MWLRDLLFSAVFATLAYSAAITRNESIPYDAIIVGGGPSGLSALSGLARVRRNVLMIDSGEYRNDPTRKMHDVLGFDGVTPAYYRNAAREQIAYYDTVAMTNGTVSKIDPKPSYNSTLFIVTAQFPGHGEQTVQARKIILATGLRDILPDTPGVREAWGKGIYWCPWCDGHEYADQPLGLLAPLNEIPATVREIKTLNSNIVAFVNGTDTPGLRAEADAASPEWETYLEMKNVVVDNRTIDRISRLREGDDSLDDPDLPSVAHHDLFRVQFPEGEPVERAAFFASFPSEQASNLGEEMGLTMYDGRLGVDQSQGFMTSIPGVYAVGDANSQNSTNVPFALYSGKRSAVFLHVALERDIAAQDLRDAGVDVGENVKRGMSLDVRDVWREMNGERGDMFYAGEFGE